MVAVKIEDLKEHADQVVGRLRETGEPVEIVEDGQVVAKLIPATETDEAALLAEDEEVRRWLEEFDKLADEIGASVPPGTTLDDVMRDVRRDR